MKSDTYQVRVKFIEAVLGSQPTNLEGRAFLAARNEAEVGEDEIVPEGERGLTAFFRANDGTPAFLEYQVKGFLKAAASVMNGKNDAGLKNLASKVTNNVFVSPRIIPVRYQDRLVTADDLTINRRPLRAQTMQGPRQALASSEQLPEGCWLKFGLTSLYGVIGQGMLEELLDYGFFSGLGAWRNAGYGRFTYTLKKEAEE